MAQCPRCLATLSVLLNQLSLLLLLLTYFDVNGWWKNYAKCLAEVTVVSLPPGNQESVTTHNSKVASHSIHPKDINHLYFLCFYAISLPDLSLPACIVYDPSNAKHLIIIHAEQMNSQMNTHHFPPSLPLSHSGTCRQSGQAWHYGASWEAKPVKWKQTFMQCMLT